MMTFREKLAKDIVLLDGAFGTYIQSLGLTDKHFGDRPGCMEYLTMESPELVTRLHRDYLAAGSDAIETNTFGGNALKLAEYGLQDKVYEINKEGAGLARKAADEFSDKNRPRYVVGSMGPTGKLPSSGDKELGNIEYGELKSVFREQAEGLIDGGVDAIVVETGQDLLEMKAALAGAGKAASKKQKDIVMMVQCTLANNGRMLLGSDISAVMTVMGYLGADIIGINCSTGPLEMEPAIRALSEKCPAMVSCVPNAGLPVEKDGKTVFPMTPAELSRIAGEFLGKYRIDVLGGCCGTTPGHIRRLRDVLPKRKEHSIPVNKSFASFYSGYDLEHISSPLKVGERINTLGSRKMKRLLTEKDYDGIVELGKEQESRGADLLDVCSVLTERSTELRDAVILTGLLAESVNIPLMIDSTDPEVIRAALERYPGTAFINSANLEDRGEKARRIFMLAKDHGAFVVNLVIDHKGMGKTVERKLEVASRLYDIGVNECGLQPHRMIFDMLTFTLGTGEDEYRDSALVTFDAIKRLKERFPGVMTVAGVSNVSFGLTKEGRKVLNMVYLHHAVNAGLDMAIVNPAEYLIYEDIPEEDRAVADDLVLDRSVDALARFVDHFADRSDVPRGAGEEGSEAELSAEDRLRKCIMSRDKKNVISVIDEVLKEHSAEHIINDILMETMREVGDKLDSGEMVLPYVLQSAEVMRKAVEYLETYLPAGSSEKKGKVLLATVFGDVHDIGKNLVKMILRNNGFEVIDLGKQVPIETIVAEARERKVDAVGLSALLVSTARYMKTCVQRMHDAGLDYPVLIGGAPVNHDYAKDISVLENGSRYSGGVFYSKDAFTGLKLMQTLMSPEAAGLMEEYSGTRPGLKASSTRASVKKDEIRTASGINVPEPPFTGIRPLVHIPADEVFSMIDEAGLFSQAWGAKVKDAEERGRLIEQEFRPLLKELKEECLRKGWLDLKCVYGYFNCRAEGSSLSILDEGGAVVETLEFTVLSDGSALTKFIAARDLVAFQAVTVGSRIEGVVRDLTEKGEISRAYFLHGLSVYVAEAVASYVHAHIRKELGIAADQGKRYSPGFAVWDDLSEQKKVFRILEVAERIGVELTEEFQMVPEQSTTAIVLHNSKAEY